MKKIYLFVIILICIVGFSKPAEAVVPPDFIFNIDSKIVQIFSLIIIFLSSIFSLSYQFIRNKFTSLNKWHILIAVILIIGISGVSAYGYSQYKQNQEYEQWLAKSELYDELLKSHGDFATTDKLKINDEQKDKVEVENSNEKFISSIDQDTADISSEFIQEYYSNIANQELDLAYEMSKQTVDLQTFKNWYTNTTKITLDSLTRINDEKSSLELTLYEGSKYTRYGVLMTLHLTNEMPVQVEKSEVRILDEGIVVVDNGTKTQNQQPIDEPDDFFANNKDTNLIVSNKEFETITNSRNSDYIVLDAREDIEYENGYFPSSTHIRFADLQAGLWIELPTDKKIYVLCWSGIRGKLVAEFLRTKNLVASYLEDGANGWVEYGGSWFGNIKFTDRYKDERFRIVLETEDVKERMKEADVQLVDSREPWKYKSSHITGAISLPIMHTPTTELENVFNQFSPNRKVIIICDGYVNCFDAKITAIELEERGHEMLGRYTKPWEY